MHKSNRTAGKKWSSRTSESATNRIGGGERSAAGRSERTPTLMIRRGRLLLAIKSGLGHRLPPLRSCGAAGALRMARRRKRRRRRRGRSGGADGAEQRCRGRRSGGERTSRRRGRRPGMGAGGTWTARRLETAPRPARASSGLPCSRGQAAKARAGRGRRICDDERRRGVPERAAAGPGLPSKEQ